MMRSTFGAPLGGITRGGHQEVESLALCLMTPPNFGGGGGICFPSMVVVALGDPGVPVTCCATTGATAGNMDVRKAETTRVVFPMNFMRTLLFLLLAQQKTPRPPPTLTSPPPPQQFPYPPLPLRPLT